MITMGALIVGFFWVHRYATRKGRYQNISTEWNVAPPTSKNAQRVKPVRRKGGGSVDHIEADSYESKIEPDYTMDDIVLKNGARIREVGYSIGYLGEITGGREPILILQGRECYECGAPQTVYLYSIVELRIAESLSYPGKVHEPDSKAEETIVVEDSRHYFGACLPGKKSVYVVISHFLNDQGKWESVGKAYTANPNGSLKADSIDYKTQITVSQDCREIPPEDTFSD